MDKRPKLKLKLSATDKTIEFLGWLSLFAIWSWTLYNYSSLPDTIPVHFDAAGQADRFGAKASILVLPLISAFLFAGLTILNRFPHVFNYPVIITGENAHRHYTRATRMIRLLKLSILVVFGLIAFNTIQTANGLADGLGAWFLPLTLALVFTPIAIFIFSSSAKNKQQNR